MRSLLCTCVVAFLGCSSAARRPAVASTPEQLGDTWIGGFDSPEGEGAYLRVDFARGVTWLHPSEERAPLGLVHPKLENDAVTFAIDDGKHRRSFQLRRQGDVLDGTVDGRRAHLTHVSADRGAIDRAFGGTYAVGGDPHALLFVHDGSLFDTRDGSERRLFMKANGRALLGAGVGTAHPSPGEATLDQPRFPLKSEEVRFESSGATLQGTLLLPPGAGPHPVVVNVHGSGRVTRKDHWDSAMARVFLARGVGVFLYDKRGVGDSGGEYVGRGGRETNNISQENLDRLAGDAAAAAKMLATRSDIERVGLIGLSQAGWIVPLAAKKTTSIRFFILMSAPAVNTTIELAYSALVGSGECLPIDEADRVARAHAPRTGFDPAETIASLDVPGLWIYGALDSSIPVPSSIAALEPLKRTRAFETTVVPSAGHLLYRVRRDTPDDVLVSPGLSPAVLKAIDEFLARRGFNTSS